MTTELAPSQLRRRFDPAALSFDTTRDVPAGNGIYGQPRALQALKFGLEIGDPTYHVFVAGPPGTGRTTAVEAFLTDLAAQGPVPNDWCYVNNFADASRPRALRLSAGRGGEFSRDISQLVARARSEVPKAFESEEYASRRSAIEAELTASREELFEDLKRRAGDDFRIETGPLGVIVSPLLDGRPLTEELQRSLSDAARNELAAKSDTMQDLIKEVLRKVRQAEQRARQQLDELNRNVVEFLVGGLVDDLVEKYHGNEGVAAYLDELREAITADTDLFHRGEEHGGELAALTEPLVELQLRRYQVNVMVDRSSQRGAPVVVELNPTYPNLFGTIEREARLGAVYTDFTLLKPGALHRANGGYLVVPARELLVNYLSYDGLKRALRSREIDIEDAAERLGLSTSRTVRPDPVPLDAKVILIGTPLLYHLLYLLDEDFNELFKVKAHFDDRMPRDDDVADYVAFVSALCTKEDLPPLDREAVARVVEHGSRVAADQTKLTTRFSDVADVIREAAHAARTRGSPVVGRADIDDALDSRVYRANLVEVRIREMIGRGTLRIEVSGRAVGQINGLSVVDLGDHRFGRPDRITASVSPGQTGVIDIEREAKLGGPIHSKGVMILSGYLADRFAHDYPLAISARLVFEQTYGGVEGDSASVAELLALLSRLSGTPIHQGIAVTGSVDQHGRVQAVSGVNEKIEGFFDVCSVLGLTGEQGVVVPAANVEHLMVRDDVVDAVRHGRFHVWSVETVEEAIELTTGVPAGTPGTDGIYQEATVFRAVDDRLRAMAETLMRYGTADRPTPVGET